MLAGKQIVKLARNIDALGFLVPRLNAHNYDPAGRERANAQE
jgi:hypothetical protein